jgi:putative heme-binding domain-containing protein
MKTILRSAVAALAALAAVAPVARAQEAGPPGLNLSRDPKPPVAPAGWKVETVLMAPDIESPSVVCALPDGRVLIGEDPLDNRGGKDPIDRILCLHPDGKTTVWADKLNPVFGLAYLDGKVYVHQYPILSVYEEIDGKAANRKDLINQTGKPTIGGLNDHIPAQIRLGMDGYFYMAVGDRGVWGAKSNIDGSEAELAGGGLLRFKPDGTKLEVYSTGTRNHLDVSLTSEDEKFTYDNTDDGHGWWTRFTHMVDGGYYGYPWDYKAPENKNDPNSRKAPKEGLADKPFQPYTLWRVSEHGGGSPCGAIGYTEDALPPEYRGKGKVQRFVVKRAGGTFALDKMEDFLTPGGDLRPLGIDTTADGLGFWVTDWGYGGWHQKKPSVGRLIKVTWTGKNHSTPKPAWYVPAAMGKKFEATTAELIEGLKHPARSVRMVAQRRLTERARKHDEVLAQIDVAIEATSFPDTARYHAIWARTELGWRRDLRYGILDVVMEPKSPVAVRRQGIRALGETRDIRASAALRNLLSAHDASVRFQVANALGRIGDVTAIPDLQRVQESDLFVRYAAFNALNRIGKADPNAWPAIVAGLESQTDAVRTNTTYALRNTYDRQLVESLVKLAAEKSKPATARSAAILAAADLARQPKPWGGNWWGTQPVGNPRPAKVVDWEGTTTVLNAIRDLASDTDPAIRAAVVKAMAIAPDAGNAELLVKLFGEVTDLETKQTILQALAPTKAAKASDLAIAVLKDAKTPAALVPHAIAVLRESGAKDATGVLIALVDSATSSPEVIESAIDTLGAMKAKEAVPAIAKRLANTEAAVWNGAVNALQAINDKHAIDALVAALQDKRSDVRKFAVVALGQMKAKDAVPAIVEAVQQKRVSGDGYQALGRIPDVRAIDVYLTMLAEKNPGMVRDARSAIEKIKADAQPIVEARLAEGKIKPEAIRVLQEVFGAFKPITNWSVVGPFTPGKPLPFDPAKLTKADGSVDTSDGAKLAWKKIKAKDDGAVNLADHTPAAGDAESYLFATIDSPSDREVFMQFGSDDRHTIWVNGTKVDDDQKNSSWKADESTVTVKLNKGRNVIVAKALNRGGTWLFSGQVAMERSGKLFEQKPAAPVADAKKTPDAYAAFALAAVGDAAKGKAVFNAQATSCIKCHQVSPTEGGLIGPSLVGVGSKYDKAKLIESVVYPSKQIFDGFQQTIVKTKDDDVIAGIVKRETDSELEIYDASANRIIVKKSDIKARKHSDISAMPEGLEQALTQQELADLIAYLQSLRESR